MYGIKQSLYFVNILVIPIKYLTDWNETHETKTWKFPPNKITIEVSKCTELWDKSVQFLQI